MPVLARTNCHIRERECLEQPHILNWASCQPLSLSLSTAVMKKFDHPHIIKLFGVVTHDTQTYIVMELAPLGQVIT